MRSNSMYPKTSGHARRHSGYIQIVFIVCPFGEAHGEKEQPASLLCHAAELSSGGKGNVAG
jgi:hypothetical protein